MSERNSYVGESSLIYHSRLLPLSVCLAYKQVREQLAVLEKQGLLYRIGADLYLEYEGVKFLALSFCDDIIAERSRIASSLIDPEPDYMDAYIESAMQFYKIEEYNNAARIITHYLVDAQIPTLYQSIVDTLLGNWMKRNMRVEN